MSTIIPASPPTIAVTVPAPSDGDTANAASLAQFVQPLENSAEAFRLLTYGGGIRRRVKCFDNTTMTIQPLGAVVVTSGGTWTVLPHTTASTVSPTTLAGGALSNSTRYWVYAYNSAGTLTFVADTTGPDVGLRYKNGSTDYQYVSTFYTDGAASIYKYTQNDNEYTYLGAAVIGGPYLLAGGSATVSAPITIVGGAIPTIASAAELGGVINTSSAGRTATCQGPLTDYWFLLTDNGVAAQPAFAKVAIFDGMGTASYVVSNAGVAFSVAVVGFTL